MPRIAVETSKSHSGPGPQVPQPTEMADAPASVAALFANRSVLITGASGFLGGLILETLLRYCPNLHKAFILVRHRRGREPQERVDRMLQSPLFSGHSKSSLERIVPITGDVSLPELGLSVDDKFQLLSSDVAVVFHVAATLSFNAPVQTAVNVNVAGTRRVLELCRTLPRVQVLVHLSTAYCNFVIKDTIREAVYPSAWDPDDAIETVLNMTPEEAKAATRRILGGQPNTYSFSKQLAENLLVREHGSLPVAIVRPSLVLGTYSDPIPGWVANVHNGLMSFMAGAGKGVFRVPHADNEAIVDVIPADFVAALCLAAAWKAVQDGPGSLKVYHGTSGSRNPLIWKKYIQLVKDACRDEPCSGCLWYPDIKVRKSYSRAVAASFVFQLLPALLIEISTRIANLLGFKVYLPLLKIQRKYIFGLAYTGLFTVINWDFSDKNTLALSHSLPPEDAASLRFDVEDCEWDEYIRRVVRGLRQYFHKQNDESLPSARRQLRVLRIIHTIFTLSVPVIIGFGAWLLFGTTLLAFVFASLLFAFIQWL